MTRNGKIIMWSVVAVGAGIGIYMGVKGWKSIVARKKFEEESKIKFAEALAERDQKKNDNTK